MERHKTEVQRLKDEEALLRAEFESQQSNWLEKEKFLSDGYSVLEDTIDGKLLLFCLAAGCCRSRPLGSESLPFLSSLPEFFPCQVTAVSQAIEALRESRRRVGADIPPNAPLSLGEQIDL